MKTLIIHPEDPTTAFLIGIYKDLPNKTVINGGISKDELQKNIYDSDQVLMLGHGSPNGLFSVGQLNGSSYIIDESVVDVLREKNNSVYIWCYADQFVKRHNLNGFATGMFISEISEAIYMSYQYVNEDIINESNYMFSSIVSKYLDEPIDVLYENVFKDYGELAKTNPIARYNWDRIYLNLQKPVMFTNKVA